VVDPIHLISLTMVLLGLFYGLFLVGLYFARRYLPEAQGLYDALIEPFLLFPAAALAFIVALSLLGSAK
jgi:hypothetical protein